MAEKEKSKAGNKIKYGGGGCLIIIVLMLWAGGTSESNRQPDYSKPRPTPTPTATPDTRSPEQKLEAEIQKILGENLEKFIYSPESSTANSLVAVRWSLHDSFTMGMTRDSAKMKTLDVLKAVKFSELKPSVVRVSISGEYLDQYGNPFTQEVIQADYSAATLAKINFDNMLTDNAWGIANSSEIHRDFRGK